MKKFGFKKSFSLLEMVVYLGLFILITAILVDFMITMSFTFNKAKIKKEVLNNARLAMEKILQDTRSSQAIYTPTSLFDSTTSYFSLTTRVGLPLGEKVTYIDYYVSGSRLWIKSEGQNAVEITSPNVKVDKFFVHRFANSSSSVEAVQVQLVVSSLTTRENVAASSSIVSTATLRGKYTDQ